ncbi:MAG: amidohydrolase family protein [Gemmatimonadota bacterium]|nr:amidohydrolase family protein [Gemmatimonadota bacterium]
MEHISPVASYYASVARQMEDGTPHDGMYAEQRMTRHEALRSYTLDAAYGSFHEKMGGSIEVGKQADFTILSKDIITVPEQGILDADVMYDGIVRYEMGKPMKPAIP